MDDNDGDVQQNHTKSASDTPDIRNDDESGDKIRNDKKRGREKKQDSTCETKRHRYQTWRHLLRICISFRCLRVIKVSRFNKRSCTSYSTIIVIIAADHQCQATLSCLSIKLEDVWIFSRHDCGDRSVILSLNMIFYKP